MLLTQYIEGIVFLTIDYLQIEPFDLNLEQLITVTLASYGEGPSCEVSSEFH